MARSLKVYVAFNAPIYANNPNSSMILRADRPWNQLADVYAVGTTKAEAVQRIKQVFGVTLKLTELRVANGDAVQDLVADGYLRTDGEVIGFRSYQHGSPILQARVGADAQIVAEWRCDRSTGFTLVIVRH